MLCNGVSFHTLCPILSFLRSEPTSPLLGLAFWSIVTSFSGCDTFLAAVRSLSPPQEYVLLSACDVDSLCRRAIHCVHVSQPVAPLIHISADSAGARVAPWSLLVYWGYPCVLFSILNRHVTPDRLQGSIDLFDAALPTSPSDVHPSSSSKTWHLCCVLTFDSSSTISYIRLILLAATESILAFCVRPSILLT